MEIDTEADHRWMQRALERASEAGAIGEVPVGCIIVGTDGELLAEGYNQPISSHDPTAHAEVVALRAAGLARANYRLTGTTLYVTLEPCVMCIGAIVHARIGRLVFGASDPKTGAVESAFQLCEAGQHNHHVAVTGGVLAEQSGGLLRDFFRARRGK